MQQPRIILQGSLKGDSGLHVAGLHSDTLGGIHLTSPPKAPRDGNSAPTQRHQPLPNDSRERVGNSLRPDPYSQTVWWGSHVLAINAQSLVPVTNNGSGDSLSVLGTFLGMR